MDVHGRFEFVGHFPERVVRRVVVEEHRVAVRPAALEVVDHGADEALFLRHAPSQFLPCLRRVVHADGREGRESGRILHHLFLQFVVGGTGQFLRCRAV